MDRQRLLDRFLRYVAVNTTAGEPGPTYPSSPGQLELGRVVLEELRGIGLSDAHQDEHGLVWATVPGNRPGAPTIALNSHFDTSPETTGANAKPQVVDPYEGGDLVLPGDNRQAITVAENPELKELVGKTLITTDGTTLLGGDDKAGLSVIVELATWLLENPDTPHGDIRLLFTCDEEIGHGVDHVAIEKVNAVACYTLDGPAANHIDVETFSGDMATVTLHGVNIHPAIGKGRMVNAIRAAGYFLDQLPRDVAPETTDGRAGFLHPYVVEGGVGQTTLKILLRDFDTPKLADHADVLRAAARQTETQFSGCKIDVSVQAQYRNLGDGLSKEPRAVAYALRTHERLGRDAQLSIIRGGTDGSMLTEKGLPTPNLSTGQHNPHSPLEWACLDEMVAAAEVLRQLVQVWAEDKGL